MTEKALKLVNKDMCKEKGFERHDGSSYATHLYDVMLLLINAGYNTHEYDNLIASSGLHDYPEDVNGATVKMVAEMFNEDIADIVGRVTKDSNINYKEDRKAFELYLKGILERRESLLLKLADRICNITTMHHSSLKHRKYQVKETEEWFLPLLKKGIILYPQDKPFFYLFLTIFKAMLPELKRGIELEEQLLQLQGSEVN